MAESVTLQTTVEVVLETCCQCGVVFGMNRSRYNRSRQHGEKFFCTNGHSQIYRETDIQRLTRELANKDQQLANQSALTKRARGDGRGRASRGCPEGCHYATEEQGGPR